jgi:putative transposase
MSEKQKGISPSKTLINIQTGSIVRKGKSLFRIKEILDFDTVIGEKISQGGEYRLLLRDLRSPEKESDHGDSSPAEDLKNFSEEEWEAARKRYKIIEPLLRKSVLGRPEAQACAEKAGVSTATIYRWVEKYKKHGVLSALVPRKKGTKKGTVRITPEQEEIIEEVIRDFYLKSQRPTQQSTVTEVRRVCYERGVAPPSGGTVRLRISRIPERLHLRSRGYKEKAKNAYVPVPGHFPNAEYPLAVIQIDHTPADILLVDDEHRKTIGRPYLTLAMDICTRMITGYYLSLDEPSATSVAMCLALSMLPKEEWLIRHEIEESWPVWGIPETIHVDNGADFRSAAFEKSCAQYGINVEHRPVKRPHFGGHIERILGTALQEMHNLPGTTFSSIKDREGYDSEKHAAMTFSEFEKWFVTWICSVYHKRKHSEIGMSPFEKWHIELLGNEKYPGRGLPPVPEDPLGILLDFLPFYERTVQPNGVTIGNWLYYGMELNPWINKKDPETGKKQRFIFRQDPRDISVVWFFDPEEKKYFPIPFADRRQPSLSKWEDREIRAMLKAQGITSPTENDVLRGLSELRAQVETSAEKTKKARKKAQKHKEHSKKNTPAVPAKTDAQEQKGTGGFLPEDEIDIFGEIS